MLTIFTCPKSFVDPHISTIQHNAIKSWTLLNPKPEIILIGDDEGVSDVARQYNLRHIPTIERNEHGTPMLRSIFQQAQECSSNELMCYINADIILFNEFMGAVRKTANRFGTEFLMVGRRINLEVSNKIDFSEAWVEDLKGRVKKEGVLFTHDGLDYFVFKRNSYAKIPPLYFARAMWDNWLVYNQALEGKEIVDATHHVDVVHQNHHYNHQVWSDPMRNPEVEYNVKLVGGYLHAFTTLNATYKLKDGKFKRQSIAVWYMKLVMLANRFPSIKPFMEIVRKVRVKFSYLF